ncbi:MAG: type II toxin-antitoxin system RelB/DinJ family antitoxin [Oscillospiraceae bacterium]|nr:type II toxin-antitoxin system RelB/DinJ family antitoxin [Oscillospiraceae bacterium]
MAQTSINIRMDEELKREFNKFCDNVGLSMSAAFCVFARTCVRQHKIPFAISDLAADPAQAADDKWAEELDLIDPED